MQSITFNVHDVVPKTRTFTPRTLPELFKMKSDTNIQPIEAYSHHKTPLYGYETDGFFCAIHEAYDNHMGLSFGPDDIKAKILHGFSIHIKENAEKFKKLFVGDGEKKKIKVEAKNFIRGSPLNPWTDIFTEFVNKIHTDLNDKDLVKHIQTSMTTTTPTIMASHNIALMETMEKYYEYEMMSECGIPFIQLCGNASDWLMLVDLVNHIEKYELEWWTSMIRPILFKILDTIHDPNNIDTRFWQNIIKNNGGSGDVFYDGWICKFFPYIGMPGGYRKNDFKPIVHVPVGISSVPVMWHFHGGQVKLKFTSGFYGFECNDGIIKPVISWLIHEDDTKENMIDRKILDTYKYGSYSSKSYDYFNSKNVKEIVCDYCNDVIGDNKPRISMGKTCLCMGCVVKISDMSLG